MIKRNRGRVWVLAALFCVGAAGASVDHLDSLLPVEHFTGVPAGATLPVSLERGCQAGKCAVGTEIRAVTTQRVPLDEREYLPRGAEVHGVVVTSEDAGRGTARKAALVIRFDALRSHGTTIPLRASTVAVANLMEVNDTFAPISGIADREVGGQANWTTRQVGGEVLTRSGWIGELDNTGMQKVGFADFNGVYAVRAGAGDVPRALGAFSAGASGLYGYDPSADLLAAPGTLSLRCACKLTLRRGDNLLLRVE